MAKARALTYEDLMDYAKAHYSKGGDSVYECWDRNTYDEYVSLFGPITKAVALEMFRTDYAIQRERANW